MTVHTLHSTNNQYSKERGQLQASTSVLSMWASPSEHLKREVPYGWRDCKVKKIFTFHLNRSEAQLKPTCRYSRGCVALYSHTSCNPSSTGAGCRFLWNGLSSALQLWNHLLCYRSQHLQREASTASQFEIRKLSMLQASSSPCTWQGHYSLQMMIIWSCNDEGTTVKYLALSTAVSDTRRN